MQRQPGLRRIDRKALQDAGGVGNVMERHRREHEIVALRRWRIGEEIELDRAHARVARRRDLAGSDLEHAIGDVGEREIADPIAQHEAEKTGARAVFER